MRLKLSSFRIFSSVQGVRHGSGKISYDFMGSRWYEGLWKNDLRDGHGEMHFASGAHYKGDWVLNVKCGFGTMVWANERESYFGQWKDDKPHGEGTYLYQVLLPGTAEASKAASLGRGGGAPETSILELAPQMHGINRYIGQFEKGLRQGHGTFFYADGARYEGQWNGNQKHGMGRFIYEDGSVYEGPFDRDRPVKPTQPVSTHGLVKLTCDDLLADEPDPEDVARALSNLLLRGASDLREIYRSAADPPSADAVEWTLRPEMFGKLMRQSGALSPFLPLCAPPSTRFSALSLPLSSLSSSPTLWQEKATAAPLSENKAKRNKSERPAIPPRPLDPQPRPWRPPSPRSTAPAGSSSGSS